MPTFQCQWLGTDSELLSLVLQTKITLQKAQIYFRHIRVPFFIPSLCVCYRLNLIAMKKQTPRFAKLLKLIKKEKHSDFEIISRTL